MIEPLRHRARVACALPILFAPLLILAQGGTQSAGRDAQTPAGPGPITLEDYPRY